MVSKLRRLIADHADLHNSDLPPNYLFPPGSNGSHSDDLTQLTVLLTGPTGTPYSEGLWRLQLRIPEDYPKNPPKAYFKTRIWHPNVEESTGAVCVDTLKRDWDPKLTLRDILVTISCLLIQPNPESALNSTAGALMQEDYNEFARRARLMTSIHAPIPQDMVDAVMEAKQRGEDPEMVARMADAQTNDTSRQVSPTLSAVRMKESTSTSTEQDDADMFSDTDDTVEDDTKENDPSLSPSPVAMPPPPSPRRSGAGKQPLSVLASAPFDESDVDMDVDRDEQHFDGMTDSERNIAANNTSSSSSSDLSSQKQPTTPRKSSRNTLFSENHRLYPSTPHQQRIPSPTKSGASSSTTPSKATSAKPVISSPHRVTKPSQPNTVTRKQPTSAAMSSSRPNPSRKPRIGLRRL
ncbi:hypothetical protein VTN49DRAFT_7593 [Thermomyces lanuginosus]|uniref:uncharacterized protein n=1 Tax=Thermomyces lanuginosus TaxID=5541 RepID=UPI0037443BCA